MELFQELQKNPMFPLLVIFVPTLVVGIIGTLIGDAVTAILKRL